MAQLIFVILVCWLAFSINPILGCIALVYFYIINTQPARSDSSEYDYWSKFKGGKR